MDDWIEFREPGHRCTINKGNGYSVAIDTNQSCGSQFHSLRPCFLKLCLIHSLRTEVKCVVTDLSSCLRSPKFFWIGSDLKIMQTDFRRQLMAISWVMWPECYFRARRMGLVVGGGGTGLRVTSFPVQRKPRDSFQALSPRLLWTLTSVDTRMKTSCSAGGAQRRHHRRRMVSVLTWTGAVMRAEARLNVCCAYTGWPSAADSLIPAYLLVLLSLVFI